MKKPQEIDIYNLPDTKHEPDGYYLKTVADMSAKNIQFIMDRHNELVELVIVLAEKAGIVFED